MSEEKRRKYDGKFKERAVALAKERRKETWKWAVFLAASAYLLVPVLMIGDLSRIAEKPIPLFIWKLRYSNFEILNPEAEHWSIRSGIQWDYPFGSLSGSISDSKSKDVGTRFSWLVLGYVWFRGGISCREEKCRRLKFNNETIGWFANTIRLIPNKFPVMEVTAGSFPWAIHRHDGGVRPFQKAPEDSLYANGIRGRVMDGDLVIEAVNGGALFLVDKVLSAHDADWGDGRLVPEIRIPDYGNGREVFVVYFLKRENTVFKCSMSNGLFSKDTVTIFNSAANLGDGRISTIPALSTNLGTGKYLQGYINGNPVY